jgi:hypothetical protein
VKPVRAGLKENVFGDDVLVRMGKEWNPSPPCDGAVPADVVRFSRRRLV